MDGLVGWDWARRGGDASPGLRPVIDSVRCPRQAAATAGKMVPRLRPYRSANPSYPPRACAPLISLTLFPPARPQSLQARSSGASLFTGGFTIELVPPFRSEEGATTIVGALA